MTAEVDPEHWDLSDEALDYHGEGDLYDDRPSREEIEREEHAPPTRGVPRYSPGHETPPDAPNGGGDPAGDAGRPRAA